MRPHQIKVTVANSQKWLITAALCLLSAAQFATTQHQCSTSASQANGEQMTSFCYPWPAQNALLLPYVVISANSTCGKPTQYYYLLVRSDGRVGGSTCYRSSPLDVGKLADGSTELYSRWQSGLLPTENTPVAVTVSFSRPVYLLSFRLHFAATVPDRLEVERSHDNGSTWQAGPVFAKNCSAEKLDNVSCQSLPSALSTPLQVTFASINDLWHMASLPESARLKWKRTLIFTDFRIVFQKVGLPAAAQIAGTDRSKLLYYSASSLSVDVVCDCHGHASACAEATGDCRCEHRTAGRSCERCASGFGNWTESTRRASEPCEG